MPRLALIPTIALLLLPLAQAWAAPAWQTEAEALPPANLLLDTEVVADAAASGGKAVRIPLQKGQPPYSVNFSTPPMTMQGTVWFTFYLRGENMSAITDPLRITLIAHDMQTGGYAFMKAYPVYGIGLKPTGYTTVSLPLQTALRPEEYRPAVLVQWQSGTEGAAPVAYLDKVEIATEAYVAPVITEVFPDKIRYEPGQKVEVRTTLANLTAAEAKVTVVGEELTGIAGKREVFRQDATLAPGEQKDVATSYTLSKEEYGREIRVRLLQGAKEVDAASEYFHVTSIPLWTSTSSNYDRGTDYRDMHTIFYVQPASGAESWRSVLFFKKAHSDRTEYFSWSPGDISDLSPTEDPFPGGEGRLTYRSRTTIRQQLAMLKSVGMWPVTYVNGTCWAESGYKLFQQHPDWFLYDANGEVAHYEMDRQQILERRDDYDFDPNTYPTIFFQGTLNHSLPEVQQYIAQQYIDCGKEMGFKGVRMDVRYLEVYPGERGFDGKEIAKTYPEADKISAASIKNVKALVHKEIPDFTFGYNYAAPEEVRDMMEAFKERCAGGGWMLDETPCTYQSKTSPYHVWKAYVRRMTSWGDQVRKFGGIYNPFDFRRGGGKYVVDNIYSSIIRLIASGRFACYTNSRLPFGDLGAFGTRYSELLFGANLDWLEEINGQVAVKAAAPVWWEDMVYWNKSAAGKRQLIVHLLNPPAVAEVEENPQSNLNPPVRDIQVTCASVGGAKPTAAYLLMAEPMEPDGQNEVRAVKLEIKDVGGKATVTVPSVIFWKMVVFEW